MNPIPWFLMHTLAWLSIAVAALVTTRLPTQDEIKDRQSYYQAAIERSLK